MFDLKALFTTESTSHAASKRAYQFQIDKLRNVRIQREISDTDYLFHDEMATLVALYQWKNSFLLAESRDFRMKVVMEAHHRLHGVSSEAIEHAMAAHPDLFDTTPLNEYTF